MHAKAMRNFAMRQTHGLTKGSSLNLAPLGAKKGHGWLTRAEGASEEYGPILEKITKNCDISPSQKTVSEVEHPLAFFQGVLPPRGRVAGVATPPLAECSGGEPLTS